MAKLSQFCTFYLDTHFFGVPVEQVQEVIRYLEIRPVPLVPEAVRGLINLRGQIVTAVDLRRRLGMKELPAGRLPMNIVVTTEDGPVSLLVDDIGDVMEAGDDILEEPPRNMPARERDLVRGVYKLAGRLLLVLNIERALQFELEASSEAAARA